MAVAHRLTPDWSRKYIARFFPGATVEVRPYLGHSAYKLRATCKCGFFYESVPRIDFDFEGMGEEFKHGCAGEEN